MIRPLDRYFFLVRNSVEASMGMLCNHGTNVIPNMDAIFKVRTSYERLIRSSSKAVADVKAARDAASRGQMHHTQEKDGSEINDEKFDLLSIQKHLKICIDWSHHEGLSTKKQGEKYVAFKSSVVQFINNVLQTPAAEFFEKFDSSRTNLEYYRVFSDIQRSPFNGISEPYRRNSDDSYYFFRHLLFVRAIADTAYAVAEDQEASTEVDDEFKNIIFRAIQFPQEYYKAGMEILSHFATVIRQKYPDIRVKIRIEQDGLTVRMVIDAPDGTKDVVEKTLDEYQKVVTGKMQPEALLEDPVDVMELRHVLEIARMEVRHKQELLLIAGNKIEELRGQVARLENREDRFLTFVGDTVERGRDDAREWRELVLKMAEGSSQQLQQALLLVTADVERGKIGDQEAFKTAVEIIKSERPSFFSVIKSECEKQIAAGSVNYFFKWLLDMLGMLPH